MNKNTIKQELEEYIEENLNRFDEYEAEAEEIHFGLFNEDYYIIGYYQAEQWLKKHNVSVFEGIEFVQDYEREHFGDDAIRTYDNAETLVNMIVYIIGEELIYQEEYHVKYWEELQEELRQTQ
jgi:Fe-S cluster assembly scaffold protein SufB